MKKIDEYINSIFKDVKGNKEVKELKDEMKSHMIESVNELKSEGKSEQESIQIAIERFGDAKKITQGLLNLFQVQRKFVKSLFRIALISLLIGLITLGGLSFVNQQYKRNQGMIIASILNIVDNDSELTKEIEEKVLKVLKSYSNVEYLELSKITGEQSENSQLISRDVKMIYGTSKSNSYSIMRNKAWELKFEYKAFKYIFLLLIPYGLIGTFFVLMVLCVFINLYHRKRLKIFG